MEYCIVIAPQLYFEDIVNGQHNATHKLQFAMRFDDKLSALEYIRTNGLTAGAKVVLCPPVESR